MKQATDRLIGAVQEALAEDPHVAAAYLYGSAARGAATPISDVDVAVLPEQGLTDDARGELVRRAGPLPSGTTHRPEEASRWAPFA